MASQGSQAEMNIIDCVDDVVSDSSEGFANVVCTVLEFAAW